MSRRVVGMERSKQSFERGGENIRNGVFDGERRSHCVAVEQSCGFA